MKLFKKKKRIGRKKHGQEVVGHKHKVHIGCSKKVTQGEE